MRGVFGGRRRRGHVDEEFDQSRGLRGTSEQRPDAVDGLDVECGRIGAVTRSEHFDQQLVLAVEVVQDAGLRQSDAVSDVPQGRPLTTGAGVGVERGSQDPGTPFRPFA
ncbi:MAG: hypothetical protein JWQ81_6594 [Amycolatopsis sp.]|nr:hypothetical protein [Amycolatopsis sp.]MCU1685855.1 hypothetical protein [Amycolatopsis sp.]